MFVKLLKNVLISNFMAIYQVGAELFRADGRSDGQTDRHVETYISLFAKYCYRHSHN
jgi:hypothetical protein